METLSLIIGYVGTVLSVFGLALKKQSLVIITQGLANAAVAVSYVLLGPGRLSGGIICFIAVAQTFINFRFISRGNDPPKYLLAVFFALYAVGTAVSALIAGSFDFPLGLLPFLGAVLYLLATSTTKDMATRVFFSFNSTVWILFDALGKPLSVPNLITHILCFISVIIGIIRVTAKKRAK